MKRLLLAATAVLGLLIASGCKNPCLELAQKICDCQSTTSLRDACNQQASDRNSLETVTPEDEETCTALMDKCDCHALDTAEGKLNCGIARDPAK